MAADIFRYILDICTTHPQTEVRIPYHRPWIVRLLKCCSRTWWHKGIEWIQAVQKLS